MAVKLSHILIRSMLWNEANHQRIWIFQWKCLQIINFWLKIKGTNIGVYKSVRLLNAAFKMPLVFPPIHSNVNRLLSQSKSSLSIKTVSPNWLLVKTQENWHTYQQPNGKICWPPKSGCLNQIRFSYHLEIHQAPWMSKFHSFQLLHVR